MGSDHDRGHGRGLAQAARPRLCRGRRDPRDRDPEDHQRPRSIRPRGTLRRIVAKAGTTLPVGGLLAVVAADEVPEAEIDAFVAGFEVPEPAAEEEAEAEGVKPRDIEVAGRRLRYLELGEGDGVPVLLVHGFGADLNTWMFTQPALAAGTAHRRAGSAGAWRLGQRSRCRRCGELDRCRRGSARRARHRAGSSRRTFDGRGDCGTRWHCGGPSASRR